MCALLLRLREVGNISPPSVRLFDSLVGGALGIPSGAVLSESQCMSTRHLLADRVYSLTSLMAIGYFHPLVIYS